MLQYADDIQIIVTNDKSINEVLQQLRLSEDATGAKVNVQKTEGLFMGKWKTDMTNDLIVNGQMIKFLPWDYGLEIRTRQKLSSQNNCSLSPGVWQSFVTIRSCNHLMRIISRYVDNTKKSEIS